MIASRRGHRLIVGALGGEAVNDEREPAAERGGQGDGDPGGVRARRGPPDARRGAAAARACPLATGHRLVGELTGGGFLERLPDGSYRIGMRLWRIGAQASAATTLRELALPHMEDLDEVTHENVQLAVVERPQGALPRTPPRAPLGADRHPGGGGASAALDRRGPGAARLRDGALRGGRHRRGPRVVHAEHHHRPRPAARLLAEVRRTGYAVTSEEMTLGSCSVAAPVLGADGEVLAAMSLVTRRQRADLRRLVPAVLAAARALSHDVVAHGGSAEWKDLA